MIVVKARLGRVNRSVTTDLTEFSVLELRTSDGDDVTTLVRRDDLFKNLDELSAFLTLRMSREARVEVVE